MLEGVDRDGLNQFLADKDSVDDLLPGTCHRQKMFEAFRWSII